MQGKRVQVPQLQDKSALAILLTRG